MGSCKHSAGGDLTCSENQSLTRGHITCHIPLYLLIRFNLLETPPVMLAGDQAAILMRLHPFLHSFIIDLKFIRKIWRGRRSLFPMGVSLFPQLPSAAVELLFSSSDGNASFAGFCFSPKNSLFHPFLLQN